MEMNLIRCECKKPEPYKTTFGVQALGCKKCGCFIIGREAEGF